MTSRFWLLYFYLSISVMGAPGMVLLTPMFIAGRFSRRAQLLVTTMFTKGMTSLLGLQPWLNSEIEINLPPYLEKEKNGPLLVGNHRSTLDVYFLLTYVPGVRVLSKLALAAVPFLNFSMFITRQIFVHGSAGDAYFRAMTPVAKGLARGDRIHVFPENTRCPIGYVGTQRFALAPFQTAIKQNIKIVPIVFSGTDAVWPKGSYKINAGRKVIVKTLEPIDAGDYSSAQKLMQTVKDRIDAELLVLETRRHDS